MTKQDIVRDMKQFVGGGSFISQSELMRYRKISKPKARELVAGLDCDDSGKAYLYFIPDVAERIKDRMHARLT